MLRIIAAIQNKNSMLLLKKFLKKNLIKLILKRLEMMMDKKYSQCTRCGIAFEYFQKWNIVENRCLNCKNLRKERENNLKNLSPEVVKSAYEVNNITQRELAVKFNVDYTGLVAFFKKHGIKGRPPSVSGRIYDVDESYFEVIDTPNKAYFLGFLYADGSVTDDDTNIKYTINLIIKKSDIEIVESFRNELKTNQVICVRDVDNTVGIRISSKKMVKDLVRLGCMQAKTHKLEFPEWLRDGLIRHFIRGYFDGDGCITHGILGNIISPCINICGRKGFLDFIQMAFISNIDFKYKELKPRMRHGNIHDISELVYGGRLQIGRLYDYFYFDADLYLNRKKHKMRTLIDNRYINDEVRKCLSDYAV